MKHRIRLSESSLHRIIKESVKKVLRESYFDCIDTNDLRINAHWTEDGYAEWEARVDNGWFTFRGTYDGYDCDLDFFMTGHSGYGHEYTVDDEIVEWFNNNLRDKVISWINKYADSFEDWHKETYGEEY